jgi:hypothetical protein
MAAAINPLSAMTTFPLPALAAALAAVVAFPFSTAAAGTLFLTAGLGFIIHADYVLRHRRVSLPRRRPAIAHAQFRRFAVAREENRLAA